MFRLWVLHLVLREHYSYEADNFSFTVPLLFCLLTRIPPSIALSEQFPSLSLNLFVVLFFTVYCIWRFVSVWVFLYFHQPMILQSSSVVTAGSEVSAYKLDIGLGTVVSVDCMCIWTMWKFFFSAFISLLRPSLYDKSVKASLEAHLVNMFGISVFSVFFQLINQVSKVQNSLCPLTLHTNNCRKLLVQSWL